MNEIKQQLVKSFQNVHSEIFDDQKAMFHFQSDWHGHINGVSHIEVYLSGLDPLTGEPIPKNAVMGKYSAGSSGGDVKASYYGDFQLRFDAVLDDGQRIEDFIEPNHVALRVRTKKPKIEYTVSNARYGFSRVDFDGTNCWRRCNGHLWIKSGKKYQKIPKLPEKSKVCYVPVKAGTFEILAEQDIPKPKENRG